VAGGPRGSPGRVRPTSGYSGNLTRPRDCCSHASTLTARISPGPSNSPMLREASSSRVRPFWTESTPSRARPSRAWVYQVRQPAGEGRDCRARIEPMWRGGLAPPLKPTHLDARRVDHRVLDPPRHQVPVEPEAVPARLVAAYHPAGGAHVHRTPLRFIRWSRGTPFWRAPRLLTALVGRGSQPGFRL
jgi:hypothetical protein